MYREGRFGPDKKQCSPFSALPHLCRAAVSFEFRCFVSVSRPCSAMLCLFSLVLSDTFSHPAPAAMRRTMNVWSPAHENPKQNLCQKQSSSVSFCRDGLPPLHFTCIAHPSSAVLSPLCQPFKPSSRSTLRQRPNPQQQSLPQQQPQ